MATVEAGTKTGELAGYHTKPSGLVVNKLEAWNVGILKTILEGLMMRSSFSTSHCKKIVKITNLVVSTVARI